MAVGRKTVASLVVIAAIVAYYALIPVPQNLSFSDYSVLRLSTFAMDTVCTKT